MSNSQRTRSTADCRRRESTLSVLDQPRRGSDRRRSANSALARRICSRARGEKSGIQLSGLSMRGMSSGAHGCVLALHAKKSAANVSRVESGESSVLQSCGEMVQPLTTNMTRNRKDRYVWAATQGRSSMKVRCFVLNLSLCDDSCKHPNVKGDVRPAGLRNLTLTQIGCKISLLASLKWLFVERGPSRYFVRLTGVGAFVAGDCFRGKGPFPSPCPKGESCASASIQPSRGRPMSSLSCNPRTSIHSSHHSRG
jgi:hypothetical protein